MRRDTFVRFMIQPSCGFVSNKSILTDIIVSRVGEINMLFFGFFFDEKTTKGINKDRKEEVISYNVKLWPRAK